MKGFKAALFLALFLPAVAGAGVLSGNVLMVVQDKEKPAGDTLLVVLMPVGKEVTADQLAKAALKDTTDAYSAFNLFVKEAGSYKLHLLGKKKSTDLIEPITVEVYDEPVEYHLVMSPAKPGPDVKYPYTVRRK